MYLDRLFKLMAEKQASDLFISCGAPINIKVNGVVAPVSTQPMDIDTVRRIAYELMTKEQAREFENEMEMNLSHLDRSVGNFRINIFRQRGTISLVIRYVRSNIPPFEQLKLPPVLLDLVMEKRGLVLVAGATGLRQVDDAGRDDRPPQRQPIGPHPHRSRIRSNTCSSTSRASSTSARSASIRMSYYKALQNALREAPDLIMIGEVRDRETMQQALLHTLTGHLCLTTLHANNSYHALSRIINLFPYDARSACCPTSRSACARSSRSGSCATSEATCSRRSRSCSIRRSSPSSSRTARSRRSRKRWSNRSIRDRRPSSRRSAGSTSTA